MALAFSHDPDPGRSRPEEWSPLGHKPTLRQRLRRRLRYRLKPLPLIPRILVFLVGWVLVLIGFAGLVLPGIQGVLTIFIGAALLSLVSELIYERMRSLLGPWPKMLRRLDGMRLKLHRRLRRWR